MGAVVARLSNSDGDVRAAAVQVLGSMDAGVVSQHVGAVVALLGSTDAVVCAFASNALSRFNQDVAADALLRALAFSNSLDESPSRSTTEASAARPGRTRARDAMEQSLQPELQQCTTPEQPAAEAELTARLENLMQAQVPVHLISTPFSVAAGYAKANEVKADNHDPPRQYCYNPNTDAPQQGGGGWMASWFRVCEKTRETKGTVFIVYNRSRTGRYGDGDHTGCFDGQAQQGELEQATRLQCTIAWVGYDGQGDVLPELLAGGSNDAS